MLRLISAAAMLVALVVSCSGAKADPPSGNGNSAKACVGGNGEGWKVPNPCTSGTPAPTPTPVPVAAYAPSYIYEGNIAGGGSNVMSTSPNTYVLGNTTSGTTAGQIALAAQVRYMENFAGGASSAGFGTFFDPVNVCGANALYCHPGWYNSAILQHCDNSNQTTFYSNAASLSGDSAYLHASGSTTPYTLAQRRYTTPGSCTNPTGNSTTVTLYENPASSAGYTLWNSIWYQNASYINSRSWYFTMWDNSGYVASTSAEYPTNSGGQASFIQDMTKMYAAAAPYQIVMNGGGPGGSNWRNLTDSSHIGQGCTGFICGAPDSFCSSNTAGNVIGDIFERPLMSSATSGLTNMQNNLPYLINSVAELYADSGCANVDLIDLEQPYNGSGNDSKNIRDLAKAVSMLLQPGDYDGTTGHRAFLQWLYNDCGGGQGTTCTNQVPIYPEYGLNFVPKTTFAKYTAGNDCDGNGTGSSSSGGAHALLIATNGTDVNSCTGAVYGRPGTCYKFGVNIGPCFVLINQSNATYTVNNSVCAVAGNPTCDKYGHIWSYSGTGPQTCLSDQGTNLGTSTATCTNSSFILNSAANGGQGAWGESTTVPTSVPACDTTGSLAHDCVLIYLSQ